MAIISWWEVSCSAEVIDPIDGGAISCDEMIDGYNNMNQTSMIRIAREMGWAVSWRKGQLRTLCPEHRRTR